MCYKEIFILTVPSYGIYTVKTKGLNRKMTYFGKADDFLICPEIYSLVEGKDEEECLVLKSFK